MALGIFIDRTGSIYEDVPPEQDDLTRNGQRIVSASLLPYSYRISRSRGFSGKQSGRCLMFAYCVLMIC